MYGFLFILTIAATIGLQGWRTVFNNFAVNDAIINGFEIGAVQSVREIPGFLSLLVIYLLFIIKEHRLSSVSILLLGFGVFWTGFFPSFYGLLLTTFIFSLGFHYFETTNQSLTLQYFDPSKAAIIMGKLKSVTSLVNIFVGLFIWVFSKYLEAFWLFIIIGISVSILGIISFFQDPVDRNLPPQHKKMIIRKKYWLFYTLNFLAGARRQIFMVFAVLLLVEKYHFSIAMISALFVLNNIINYFLAPIIAKSINRFGERKVLSLEYFSLIFIFFAYAYIENPFIIGILYVLDHIFFNFAMGIKTYFQKSAHRKDIAPSMAVSFTINHITAVILPVIGGMLWMIDNKIPFLIGTGLSALSFIFVQRIKIQSPSVERTSHE